MLSIEYSMHCINYAKREQEKGCSSWLFGHVNCTIKSSISLLTSYILYKLVVFGLSMLNSNQTNHIKLCNKLANQKCSHTSLWLRDSNMILWSKFSLKEDHHRKLSLNYDKQFNKGGYSVTMSYKKGGTYELFLSIFISLACLRNAWGGNYIYMKQDFLVTSF